MKKSPLKTDRIGPNADVFIDGDAYRASRPTSTGWELVSVGADSRIRLLSHAELDRGEDDGTIVVKHAKTKAFEVANMSRKERRDMFIADYWMGLMDDGLRQKTLASTGDKALEALIEANKDDLREKLETWDRDAEYDHAAARLKKPRKRNVGSSRKVIEAVASTRHLRRQYQRYVERGRGPMAMRKHNEASNDGGKRISDGVRSKLEAIVTTYASEANPTYVGVHKKLKAQIVLENLGVAEELREVPPCLQTVTRAIKGLPEGQKFGARKGARAMNYALGAYGAGPEYRRVGERVEHDCWNIPLFVKLKLAGVIDEVPAHIRDELQEKASRIYVAASVDKASGYITGMRFGLSENSTLTIATLRMSLTDKSKYAAWAGCESPWNLYSGIEEGVTDGGPAYANNLFLGASLPAFGRHVYTAGGLPHLRGLVESIYSTMHKGFITKLIARAFANVVELGDYEADKRAALTLEQFLRLMIRYVVDIYHNQSRYGGLRQSPRREFEAKAAEMDTKPPPTADEVRVWFGKELTRKLGPGGIVFMHVRYDSNWLVKYRVHMGLEEVVIRVDEEDLGAISVLLDGDWITVPTLDPEFRGISLAHWVALLHDLRMRFGEQEEVDFRLYVAPALMHIHDVSAAAEKAMDFQEVVWTAEIWEREEALMVMRPVYDTDPSTYQAPPSFGAGSIGRRYDRPASVPPTDLAEPVSPPTPAPSTITDEPEPPVKPPRRRMKFRED